MNPLRICMWSGPRNVSTAVMYSFAQRSDTKVLDEPLYSHYLRTTGANHPGKDEIMSSMENDGQKVVENVILGPCEKPILFMKQMAHHLVDIDRSFITHTRNILLIRDPVQMLPSLEQRLPSLHLKFTGLSVQAELLDEIMELGQEAVVLDSKELLLDPEGVLQQLCDKLNISFDPAMLHWPAGTRAEDGVWAKHWYHNVHRSTGFKPFSEKKEPFPEKLLPLLEECMPYYEKLNKAAIKAA